MANYRKANKDNISTMQSISKKQIIIAAFLILVGCIMLVGTTYAIFTVLITGEKKISVTVGQFEVTFSDSQYVSLSNVATMSLSEVEEVSTPYQFTIDNKGDIDAYYTLSLLDEGALEDSEMVDKRYLGFSLKGTDGTSLEGTLDELGDKNLFINRKLLKAKDSVTFSLYLWLTEDAPNTEQGKTYQSKVAVDSVQVTGTFADKLIAKANKEGLPYQSGVPYQMYTYNHALTAQTTKLVDYRYVGTNPHNYVTFNDEVWRIVGVFEVEGEHGYAPRVKLVRDTGLEGIYGTQNDFPNLMASMDYYNTLTAKSRQMISNATYYLGALDLTTTSAETFYQNERSQVGTGEVSKRQGLVGLLSASDYAYSFSSDSSCFSNILTCSSQSWLSTTSKEGLLSPIRNTTDRIFALTSTGGVESSMITESMLYRPVVYLSSNVLYLDGDGSQENPYQLAI